MLKQIETNNIYYKGYVLEIDTYNKLRKLIKSIQDNKKPSSKIWSWLIGSEVINKSNDLDQENKE